MPTSQIQEGLQQSLEHAVPTFDWSNCPKNIYEALQAARDSRRDSLTLFNRHITNVEVLVIVAFLNAHPHIKTLNVPRTFIDLSGVNALADISTITTLDISFNSIGDEEAKALARTRTITALNVSNNCIGDAGAIALASSPTITTLNVQHNEIGDRGAIALAGNGVIIDLNISMNNIGDRGAIALASNPTITALNVSNNRFGDAGAIALASSPTITDLNVSFTHIGDAGAKAFVRNMILRTLNVEGNKIAAVGAGALIQWDEYRNGVFKEQKMAFLMGCKKSASMQLFVRDRIFDKNILSEIFDYIPSRKCNLVYSPSPEILESIKKTPHQSEVEESKLTQEEFDIMRPHVYLPRFDVSNESRSNFPNKIAVSANKRTCCRSCVIL